MQPHQNGNRRLDSWKEIAAHLGRNERTAIRWEKKGLPVHRVPGGQRQAVFAYTEEIDAWLLGQKSTTHASESRDAAESHKSTGREQTTDGRSSPIRKWVLFAACLGLLAAVAGTFIRSGRSRISASPKPFTLDQLTDDGLYKLDLQSDGTTIYLDEAKGTHRILGSIPITGGRIHAIPSPFPAPELEDISKDRQSLLVTSSLGVDSERPLWVFRLSDGSLKRVGNAFCGRARWSPDNSRIACRNGRTIVVLDANGSVLHTLGPFPAYLDRLLWSPEGNWLQFVLEDPATHLHSASEIPLPKEGDISSVTPSRFPVEGDCCLDWTWTRNGKNLVYVRFDENRRPIVAMKSRNSGETGQIALENELALKIRTVEAVTPGETENTLYFLVQGSYRGELLKIDPRQGTSQAILHGVSGIYLSFSRDGQWMTYTNTTDQTLWRSRVDGTDAIQLTKEPMVVELSSWSPDGRQIAFMGQQPGRPWRLFLIGRDGGTPQEAAEGNDNQGAPTWSPDGKELVYANVFCEGTENCWVRRLNLVTRKTEILPGSNGLRTARWSPDGKFIAALQPDLHQLMLFDLHTLRWHVLADSVSGDNVSWSNDSRFIYVDNPYSAKPAIERIRVRDKLRTEVLDLSTLRNVPGQIGPWFGLAPDNSPILLHMFTTSEIYKLEWSDQ